MLLCWHVFLSWRDMICLEWGMHRDFAVETRHSLLRVTFHNTGTVLQVPVMEFRAFAGPQHCLLVASLVS